MRHHRLTRSAAAGLALVALAAPAPAAHAQDLRSPDARDTPNAAPAPWGDLRSPDARGTASNAGTISPRLRGDLRTPDTRDAAEGRGTFSAPDVMVVKVQQPSLPVAAGIDWGDAGIGAGTLFAVILFGLGSAVAIRRHGAPASRETATTG